MIFNCRHIDFKKETTYFKKWGVKPGWFVRHGTCSIWFEIIDVFDNSLTCVARDPKKGTEYCMLGDFYGAIDEVTDTLPDGSWIKANREKNFYDKFNPEGWEDPWKNIATMPLAKIKRLPVRRKEYVPMERGDFETGATEAVANDLILYIQTTQELSERHTQLLKWFKPYKTTTQRDGNSRDLLSVELVNRHRLRNTMWYFVTHHVVPLYCKEISDLHPEYSTEVEVADLLCDWRHD